MTSTIGFVGKVSAINGVLADDTTTIICLQKYNAIKKFNDNVLELIFPLYKSDGTTFQFTNSIFKSSSASQKIILQIDILYKWLDVEYPPRFNFNLMINDNIYMSRNLGISDEMDINNFIFNLIIDIKNNDTIKFMFVTDFENDNFIEIISNSHIILKTF
jgi:hypothetical protein